MVSSSMFSLEKDIFPIAACRFQRSALPCPHSLRRIRQFILPANQGFCGDSPLYGERKLRLSSIRI
jgi:hypothetical protein